MKATDITVAKLEAAYAKLGYKLFDLSKSYNLNIFGIRNAETRSNKFDDYIGCYYNNGKNTILQLWPATTDPGEDNLTHPINDKGTAVLCPGQHLKSHKLGFHKGQYPALVQHSPIKVYRDTNRNVFIDPVKTNIDEGIFGINIHRANANRPSLVVGEWSAGCQVFQSPVNFNIFMEIVNKSAQYYGDVFSYTLFLEGEVL